MICVRFVFVFLVYKNHLKAVYFCLSQCQIKEKNKEAVCVAAAGSFKSDTLFVNAVSFEREKITVSKVQPPSSRMDAGMVFMFFKIVVHSFR